MSLDTHPAQLGKYRIIDVIGEGTMGVVYRAEDPDIGRAVAIKVIRVIPSHPYLDEKSCLERFQVEARSAGNLRHHNIVTIFDVAIDSSPPYLVMDYIEGVSLERLLAERKRLDPYDVMHYLYQIALGLDYAHSKGVIHRDIKPANILIGPDHTAYILDFGVATITGHDRFEQNATVVGSPAYMSPEQVVNEEIDGRSDVFSLAVVAYESLSGRRPFDGDNFTVIAEHILNGSRPSLDEFCPELPLALEAVFEKGLSSKKVRRPKNATTLIMMMCDALGIKSPVGGASAQRGYTYVAGGDKNADVFRSPTPGGPPVEKPISSKAPYKFGTVAPVTRKGRLSPLVRILVGLILLAMGAVLVLQETADLSRLLQW